MITRRRLLVGGGAVLLAGGAAVSGSCASLRHFPFDEGHHGATGPLEVSFFSVGCFLVRHAGLSLLTDPFFTHIPLWQAASGKVVSDPAEVDPYRAHFADVHAITVGHGHYDHVLDLSEVAADLPAGAQVIGNPTVAHTFAPLQLPLRFVDAGRDPATESHPGSWHEVVPGLLRVLPIAGGHPDNIPGVHLFRRQLSEDRNTSPARAHHYQEGATYAFLVDWLKDGDVTCRVYVQTSSRGLPDGAFPPEILRQHPVDVALLAMDCANAEVAGRETIQDRIRPRRIFFCHYGDFFRRKDQPRRETVKVDLKRTQRLVTSDEHRQVLFPAWDSRFVFQLP